MSVGVTNWDMICVFKGKFLNVIYNLYFYTAGSVLFCLVVCSFMCLQIFSVYR